MTRRSFIKLLGEVKDAFAAAMNCWQDFQPGNGRESMAPGVVDLAVTDSHNEGLLARAA